MLLIHCAKITTRVDYTFKHIFNRILGLEVGFTTVVEEFIQHPGPKISYGKQPMGNAMFFQSAGLLESNGIEDVDIQMVDWELGIGFFPVGKKSQLPFDVFSASFYLLSRYEEYLPYVKDEAGRFPPTESLAYKHGFLKRPVVDEWAYVLMEILKRVFPEVVFPERSAVIHSLLKVEEPYMYRKKGVIRSIISLVSDLGHLRFKTFGKRIGCILGGKPDPLDVYSWIVQQLKRSNNPSSSFFLLGEHPVFKKGFNTTRQHFISLLKHMSDYREVGLLLSPLAIQFEQHMKEELQQLEAFTLRKVAGSSNFDFIVSLPEPYRNLVEQEVSRDYSMVYEDQPGFRASTCTPFLFYDLDFEIKTPLVIHPIAFTTAAFNQRYESDSLQQILEMMKSVIQLNGTFSVFFSNYDLMDVKSNSLWRNLFSEKFHPDEA